MRRRPLPFFRLPDRGTVMGRVYIRVSPTLVEDKEADGYPDGAITAYVKLLGKAAEQPSRGYFLNGTVLRGYMGRHARWVKFMVEHADLVPQPDGRLYVERWEEWQEGDLTVADRVRRIRARRNAGGNDPSNGTSNASGNGPRARAASTKHVSTSTKHPAETVGAVTKLTDSQAAIELAVGMEELLGHQLSAIDLTGCETAIGQYAYMDGSMLIARAKAHLEHCAQHQLPKPRTVQGFFKTWRSQNDYLADHGGHKPETTVDGRQSGFTRAGDVLTKGDS